MKTFKWIRVTRRNPCVICKKPDYCDFCPELELALCMRIESDRPSKNRMGGWLHRLDGKVLQPFKYLPEKPKPAINATALMREFKEETRPEMVLKLSDVLGVAASALLSLGLAWAEPHHAWAFPMKDGWSDVCGIRLRDWSGNKWAVTGSRQGIFLPETEPDTTGFIVEGPTDVAAGLTIGLFCVGRPSCNCGEDAIRIAFRRLHVSRAVICSDNDTPGLRGAEKIATALKIPTCVWVPPAKDLRQFVNLGGTREMIESSIKSLVWGTA